MARIEVTIKPLEPGHAGVYIAGQLIPVAAGSSRATQYKGEQTITIILEGLGVDSEKAVGTAFRLIKVAELAAMLHEPEPPTTLLD